MPGGVSVLFDEVELNIMGQSILFCIKKNIGYSSRVGTFGTESAVRKRGGSRNLPYLNAKPRQIPLLFMHTHYPFLRKKHMDRIHHGIRLF